MKNLSRRSLVYTSAQLAGGAALLAGATQEQQPPALRGTVTGSKVSLPPLHNQTESEGEPSQPEARDKRMGVAVVGLGHLSLEQILPGFGEASHVRLTALVSGEPEKARTIAAQHAVPDKGIYDYKNFDSIKDNADVDIVYIVLPNSMHAEFTLRAAKAGKHVLCEKPMAISVRECQQMIDGCREANRQLMIAYRLQYDMLHRELITMTRTKQYGDIRFISAVNGQNDAPNGQWRQIKALAGGGSLPDVGLYCFNAFRYLTGEEPEEVTGQLTQPKNDRRFHEIEDICTFTLRFPSGIFASGSTGYSFHESRHLRIMATDAWFGADPAFSYNNLAMQIGRKAGKANSLEQRHFAPKNQFAVEMDDFAQRLHSQKGPLTPGEEGLQDQKITDAIYQSATNGGAAVRLPRVTKLDSTRGEKIEFPT